MRVEQIKIIMRTITLYLLGLLLFFFMQSLNAQEAYQQRIEALNEQKSRITEQEKKALKAEVEDINQRFEKGEITKEQANTLKTGAAEKRALNIENRIAIVDNKIELLERNGAALLELDTLNYASRLEFGFGHDDDDGERIFGVKLKKNRNRYVPRNDIRTYSDFVLGVGFHNNVIRGQALSDTPHPILGSRYFELGYLWNTRVLKKSNWLRLNYGVIYESKGLKSGNQIFTQVRPAGEGPDVILQDANEVFRQNNIGLKKSKFRQDAFIFPVHLEFGPSSKRENGDYFRYSTRKSFKFGIGVYLGFPVKNIQKIKFEKGREGNSYFIDNMPLAYSESPTNAPGGFWGWSAYAGRGDMTVVFKLEGSDNLLSGSQGARQNISLGLRFEL